MERREFLKLTGTTALAATILGRSDAVWAQNDAMNHLIYPLQDGWIHHWLVTPRHSIVIPNANYKFDPKTRPAILQKFHNPDSQVLNSPVEGESFEIEGTKLSWNYHATPEDHLVDLAVWYGSSRFVRAWAYVELVNKGAAREIEFEMFTNGPSDVYINDLPVHRDDKFDYVTQRGFGFKANLAAGRNRVLVRLEHVFALGGPLSLGLRLKNDEAGDFQIELPTRTVDVARRQSIEAAFERVYTGRDIYGPNQEIQVVVPGLAKLAGRVPVELWDGKNKLKTAVWDLKAGDAVLSLGKTDEKGDGNRKITLQSDGVRRELGIKVFPNEFSFAPRLSDEERRQVVLQRTATKEGTFAAQVARMELGRWREVDLKPLQKLVRDVNEQKDGADGAAMELLGMGIRYGVNPAFPAALRGEIEDCLLGFKYWHDEPGQHSMNFGSENHQLTFHTAEILAGELFPDRIFVNNGKSGVWHLKHGVDLTTKWLDKREAYGFEEWDANGYLMSDISILSHLRLSRNPMLARRARQLIDKIVFSVALNTFKGTYGSTHGRTQGEYIKDARSEPTAPVAWLLWGVGTLNHSLGPSISLAAIKPYELPDVLRSIALDQPTEMWGRERQGIDPKIDPRSPGFVDKVTYKTADFMLSSAQSWKAGERGYQQHIWQATLGLGAAVWVNHPAVMSEDGNHRPNFWMGNITLPRTAQWKDALVSVHRMRPQDWLGWTHAYFPTGEFDEWKIEGDWAFARRGDGYLALRAQKPMRLIEVGKSALRELRSTGRENVWICQMGNRAKDGDFASFGSKVRALPIEFSELSVAWTTLRGQKMEFGWEGPLRLDGQIQKISDFPHFDNPYAREPWPAKKLEINHRGQSLTLEFGA